jgi:hypothetical protein
MPAGNFSYPTSAAAVVFGVNLSSRAVFRLDRNALRNPLCNLHQPLPPIIKKDNALIDNDMNELKIFTYEIIIEIIKSINKFQNIKV